MAPGVSRAWCRSALAMLSQPLSRRIEIAVLRRVAITCAVLPVRTCERSSSKVTSRTQCSAFSIAQWPWAQAARTVGGA